MEKLKLLIVAIPFLWQLPIFAQVQIDHALQFTGNGSNARVSGIHAVIDSADAPNVAAIQNGSLIYATATGSSNNFTITISPTISVYQPGMVINFISNQTITGPTTLNVNSLGAVSIKKYVNQNLGGCDIQNSQIVTVVYDGTNFQMTSLLSPETFPTMATVGPDQSNVPNGVATLVADTPVTGTGIWSVVSGSGGSFANASNPATTFTGVFGSTYILSWTISTSCESSSDSVSISFSKSITDTIPGGPDTFTVLNGVTSITFNCWGAGGAGSSPGLGGNATGTLAVTGGSQFYIFVGGQDGTNGGGQGMTSHAGGITVNGGGASDIRQGGTSLTNRIIVAGGGGGGDGGGNGGGGSSCTNGAGGAGGLGPALSTGTIAGSNGTCTTGGAGGTVNSSQSGYPYWSAGGGGGGLTSGGGGGAGGPNSNSGTSGSLGTGGNFGSNTSCNGSCCGNNTGPGGGGGYYGGGGGGSGDCGAGGGGGGSSWASPSMTNTSFSGGVQSGNGQVVISW